MESVVAGIDVSARALDVHVAPVGLNHQVPNTTTGLQRLASWLREQNVEMVVMEATGGYEVRAHVTLSEHGCQVAVVNPRQIRDYAKAIGLLEKNDRIDATVLSRYGIKERPTPVRPASTEECAFRALVSRRQQLVAMITQESNRIAHPEHGPTDSYERVLALLRDEKRVLEARIAKLIRESPEWRSRVRRLQSAPGIGPTLAAVLLTYLPELGTLSKPEITKLAGLAPLVRDSGRYRGQRRIGGGRSEARGALYMAVLVGLRHQLPIAAHFKRLVARGKPGSVAIVACMRKLLVQLNAMERDGVEWDSSRLQPLPA
ncbi:MAG TPA: IS110 family transposase [Gemmatimonadetes bacterium]|nr:IS110 family transposase [Gemmatimonadota bacterium]